MIRAINHVESHKQGAHDENKKENISSVPFKNRNMSLKKKEKRRGTCQCRFVIRAKKVMK